MTSWRRHSRTAGASVAASTFLALSVVAGAAPASAQAACGDTYVMQEDDTVYHVTQQCRVTLEALLDANPQIDNIDAIPVGAVLEIPAGAGLERPATYAFREGDTLFSIAQQFGTTAEALRSANPELDIDDIPVGTVITIPTNALDDAPFAGSGDPTISLQPLAGAPGTPITVRGTGLPANENVTIGAGPPESEWRSITTARVGEDGTVEALVAIPDWADPGRSIVFVIDTASGRTLVSNEVDVVEERNPDEPNANIVAEGRISDGVECPILTTPDGIVYALTASNIAFDTGAYVEVEGRLADASFCQQGEGTIEVATLENIEPPARDRDPAEAGGVPLTQDYVLGTWVAKGGNCAETDFAITANSAGGQVVDATVNGIAQTGYVSLGDEPVFVFDDPDVDLPIETRGPDGLAVMPPPQGEIEIGEVPIVGDGVVFIRCDAPD